MPIGKPYSFQFTKGLSALNQPDDKSKRNVFSWQRTRRSKRAGLGGLSEHQKNFLRARARRKREEDVAVDLKAV